MTQEQNQPDRPPITRNNPPQQGFDTGSGGRGGGRRDSWDMPRTDYPRRDNNGGGGWGRIIAVAVVVILICCGFTYWQVSGLNSTYQTLPSQVSDAISSLNTAIAGIPTSIAAQVETALTSIRGRLEVLEGGVGGYGTTAQWQSVVSDIASLQSQINTINAQGYQGQIDDWQDALDDLTEIIENSDLQHNTITVKISDYGYNFTNNVTTANTVGYISTNIVLEVKNTKNHSVKLNTLEITLNTGFSLGAFMQALYPWYTLTVPPSLTYISTYGTGTITSVSGSYVKFSIDISSMGLTIDANSTKTISFVYRFDWTAGAGHSKTEIDSIISNFTITPVIVSSDYVLTS